MLIRPSAQPCVFCSFRAAASQDSIVWFSNTKHITTPTKEYVGRKAEGGVGVRSFYHRSKTKYLKSARPNYLREPREHHLSKTLDQDEVKFHRSWAVRRAYQKTPLTEYGRFQFYQLDFSEILAPVIRQEYKIDSRTFEFPAKKFIPDGSKKATFGIPHNLRDRPQNETEMQARTSQHQKLFQSITLIRDTMRQSPEASLFSSFYDENIKDNTDMPVKTRARAIGLLVQEAIRYNTEVKAEVQIWRIFLAMSSKYTKGTKLSWKPDFDLRCWNKAVISHLSRSNGNVDPTIYGSSDRYTLDGHENGFGEVQGVIMVLSAYGTARRRQMPGLIGRLAFDPQLDRTTALLEAMYPLLLKKFSTKRDSQWIRRALQPMLTTLAITPNLLRILLRHADSIEEIHKIKQLVLRSGDTFRLLDKLNFHFVESIARIMTQSQAIEVPLEMDIVAELSAILHWFRGHGMSELSANSVKLLAEIFASKGAFSSLRQLVTKRDSTLRSLNFTQVAAACMHLPTYNGVDVVASSWHRPRYNLRSWSTNQSAELIREYLIPAMNSYFEKGIEPKDKVLIAIAGALGRCGDSETLWKLYVSAKNVGKLKHKTLMVVLRAMVEAGNVHLATAMFRSIVHEVDPQLLASLLPLPTSIAPKIRNAGFPLTEIITTVIERGLSWGSVMKHRPKRAQIEQEAVSWDKVVQAWGEEIEKCIHQTINEKEDGVADNVIMKVEDMFSCNPGAAVVGNCSG